MAFGCHLPYAYYIIAQLLKGKSDNPWGSINTKVTNYCFDRLIWLRVQRETVEVVLSEIEQNVLVVDQAVGNNANPSNCLYNFI
jgi:hypothetical protein